MINLCLDSTSVTNKAVTKFLTGFNKLKSLSGVNIAFVDEDISEVIPKLPALVNFYLWNARLTNPSVNVIVEYALKIQLEFN